MEGAPGEDEVKREESMTTDLTTLKRLVADGSRVLDATGVADVFGHLSIRVPDSDRFLLPSAMSPGLVTDRDILIMNWDCQVVEGDGRPFIEAVIHSSIYRARPDVHSVAHFHSPMAIVLSMVGQGIRPVVGSNSTLGFLNGTPIYDELTPTMTTLITTREQGENMAKLLGDCRAVLLKSHGSVVVGSDVKETCLRSFNLERLARLQVFAEMVGSPQYLSPEEVEKVRKELKQGNPMARGKGAERFWDYFLSKSSLSGASATRAEPAMFDEIL
jgi:ribulose-5-phosphate 4-epimerase/fuculose-1-phosphate aldolase